MDFSEFTEIVGGFKKIFASENPWVNAFMVVLLGVIITVIAILWAWHKGEVRADKYYPLRHV